MGTGTGRPEVCGYWYREALGVVLVLVPETSGV